jgi:hypothetical protein
MNYPIMSYATALPKRDSRTSGWESTKARVAVPDIVSPSADANAERRKRFNELADQWSADTTFMSSIASMVSHPAYNSIVEMGAPATALILERLEKEPDFWFDALRRITQQDPVPQEDVGNMDLMTQAWLMWGEKNGYR